MEETVIPGFSKDETNEETTKRLRTVRSILAKYGSDPTYKVKSKGSKYYGYDLDSLKAEEFKLETIKAHQEHAEKLLKRTQPLSTQLQEKKVKLKPPKKQEKRETTRTSLEKAVMTEDLILSLPIMKRTFLNRIGKAKEVASLMKVKN